jgi:hypothetical protein
MRKPQPLASTRTQDLSRRELPLTAPPVPPPPVLPKLRPADRIRDALLRWLEEEM